jgi:hypothetical protein
MPSPRPGVEWESTYDPSMAPRVTELMAQGKTRIEVAAALGIHRKTLEYWTDPKDHRFKKDLAIALSKGIDKGFCWWISEGRDTLRADKFQASLYAFLMSNLFGFRFGASRDDEALQEIKKLKEQMGIEDN